MITIKDARSVIFYGDTYRRVLRKAGGSGRGHRAGIRVSRMTQSVFGSPEFSTLARESPSFRPMRSRNPRPQSGFTLVELMVVVLIISVLAMLAVPAITRVKRKAKTAAILNDFRVFAAAFETYAHETGNWPAETAAGVLPTEMAARLNAPQWTRITPMGGHYDWESNQIHFGATYRAAIAIKGTADAPLPLDANQLIDLERALDGPNVSWLTGTFHMGTGNCPLYIIQP